MNFPIIIHDLKTFPYKCGINISHLKKYLFPEDTQSTLSWIDAIKKEGTTIVQGGIVSFFAQNARVHGNEPVVYASFEATIQILESLNTEMATVILGYVKDLERQVNTIVENKRALDEYADSLNSEDSLQEMINIASNIQNSLEFIKELHINLKALLTEY